MPYNFKNIVRYVNKNLGKALILNINNPQYLRKETNQLFLEERNYKRKETMFTHQRHLRILKKSYQQTKYWEDRQRYYQQKQASFFVHNVLSKKKIYIPLR